MFLFNRIAKNETQEERKPYLVKWKWASFNKLSKEDMYDLLSLRAEIFCEEQNYAYNDLDHRDKHALHLMGFDQSKVTKPLIACARLLIPTQEQASLELGRVMVDKNYRRLGLGTQLLSEVIRKVDHDYPYHSTELTMTADPTSPLEKFYHHFGFVKDPTSENPSRYTYKNFEWPCFTMKRPPAKKLNIEENGDNFFQQMKQKACSLFRHPEKEQKEQDEIEMQSVLQLK